MSVGFVQRQVTLSSDRQLRMQKMMRGEPRRAAGGLTSRRRLCFDHGIITGRGGRREVVVEVGLEHRAIARIRGVVDLQTTVVRSIHTLWWPFGMGMEAGRTALGMMAR